MIKKKHTVSKCLRTMNTMHVRKKITQMFRPGSPQPWTTKRCSPRRMGVKKTVTFTNSWHSLLIPGAKNRVLLNKCAGKKKKNMVKTWKHKKCTFPTLIFWTYLPDLESCILLRGMVILLGPLLGKHLQMTGNGCDSNLSKHLSLKFSWPNSVYTQNCHRINMHKPHWNARKQTDNGYNRFQWNVHCLPLVGDLIFTIET